MTTQSETVRVMAAAVLTALLVVLNGCTSSTLEPPRRQGPPGMVAHGGEERLWLFVKQEEKVHLGPGRRSTAGPHWETRYHFELHGHDPKTAQRLWKKRLLTLKDGEGGHGAQARIIGQDGDKVWLFLNDQPLAVSSADGTVVANRARIEEANPALRDLIPSELKFYAFDRGLVITTADARRVRVNASDYTTVLYPVADEQAFQRLAFMTHTWNGGYNTKDFLVRQAMMDGRWIGMHTEREAADAGNDGFGDRLKDPSRVLDEGALARRGLWTARIGKTRAFSEGAHDRLFDVTRLPGTPEFLQGGFLIRQGTREPLRLKEPEGIIAVHRTRVDAEGWLALTRLDINFREQWKAVLPFTELRNRWQYPDRLLLLGAVQITYRGVTGWQDFVVAVDLRDGRIQAWNVTLEYGDKQ